MTEQTILWIFGVGLTIFGIVVGRIYHDIDKVKRGLSYKVDKQTCAEHLQTQKETDAKIDKLTESSIRVETALKFLVRNQKCGGVDAVQIVEDIFGNGKS